MKLPTRIEYQLGWMALSMLFGLSYLTAVPSSAVRALLPGWLFIAWAAGLLLSGAGGAAGAVLGNVVAARRRYWGLSLERAAIRLQAGVVGALGVATVYVWLRTPGTAFPAIGVSLVGVWIVINLIRDRGIGSEIRSLPTTDQE